MKSHKSPHPQPQKHTFWIVGLASLTWFLLRSGSKPRRMVYPCQRVALASSLGFLGYLVSLAGTTHLYRRLRRRTTLTNATLFFLALSLTAILGGSNAPATPVSAALSLPTWTSPTAVSNVFVVAGIPVPECSLAGGVLPVTAPCNQADYALRDDGIDSLIEVMARQGVHFYESAAHPTGIVSGDDVVVIKVNNQWAGYGEGNIRGRFSTNTDVVKGLIWRVLLHPEGFSGEIVVAENTQMNVMDWDFTPANAEDQNQSFLDVVGTFRGLGYPVSLYLWDDLNENLIRGGSVNDSGYPAGEYINGDSNDAYILLEDSAASGSDELSYPKFRTAGGNMISMRYGVWNGSAYEADRLTFINVPILKRHGMAGSTIAWKNLIGLVTIFDTDRRYGNWDAMHDFFWGYTGGANRDYGLIGRELALIRAPDLNVVDAIWVATEDNTGGPASRQDILLASSDPFAVDWYASEYVLRPVSSWPEDASAARAGIFRDATRTNQNAAASVWPGGSYAYIDLLDSYNGDVPSDEERNRMNVYLAGVVDSGEGVGDIPPVEDVPPVQDPPVETEPLPEVVEPPPPSVAVVVGGLLEDFEAGTGAWAPFDDGMGSSVSCVPDTGVSYQGRTSLRMQYSITTDGWGGCDRYFDSPPDWDGSVGISLQVRFESSSQPVTLMVFAGNPEAPTPFVVIIDPGRDRVGEWVKNTFSWGDFVLAEWADVSGLSELDPAQVISYGFTFDESEGENTFWIDDIKLTSAEVQQPIEGEVLPEPGPQLEPVGEDEPQIPDASEEGESSGGRPCPSAVILPFGVIILVELRRRGSISQKVS